ncbi:MAG TPA: glycosyltransferase family 39 protein [Dokdonella sp.]|uniref:ArnT family glycosyltransferase n=1 Tax=Dokdonella sp. TaxID=2291710 RepID=UPI002CD25B25|nr:glycosyltransferase family 39 protein [Dokdonella sp.]HOX71718.1 glycosyltransferase family 39 protein [Dokdonella sp.]
MSMPLPLSDSRSRLFPGVWAPVWLAATLIAIFQTGAMPLYSTRTLGVAWEMWNSGQFLVPYSNGEPYSHKVPLLFWLIHAGWAIGGVGDVWPRLLEVLIGLGILLLAQRLARILFRDRPQVARLTPWLLAAFSYAFLFSLQIMYEMLLGLCVLAALNALVGRDPDRPPWFVLFALAVGTGLLSKGPVMLLHVVFPYLLGPLWHPWARRWRSRWYLRGALALLGGCALLIAWALPAGMIGGEAYRNELFFMQTAGRVVDSFDHARPWWWYASVLPALLLPWLLWPRAWQAFFSALGQHRQPGLRLLACWLIPVLIGFSLVSGKQTYYLLPELAGVAILIAAGLPRSGMFAGRSWGISGSLLLALVAFAFAVLLLLAPGWVADGRIETPAYIDLASASPWFAVAATLLGVILLLPTRSVLLSVATISTASIIATCLACMVFAQTLWPRFDLQPAASHIADLQKAGIDVAHFHVYENQFQFLGRLTRPLDVVHGGTLEAWVKAHPEGRIVHYVAALSAADMAYAEMVQPFRAEWLLVERADQWLMRERGGLPPMPVTPARQFPEGFWPYRRIPADPRPGNAAGAVVQ